MTKATPNPVEYTYGARNTGSTAHSIPHPEPISAITVHIAGLLVTVFGLSELPPPSETTCVSALWLLHPRLQTKACMAPFGAHLITEWNTHRKKKSRQRGLIAISFDQRNHGSRLVSPLANEAWRSGNDKHALDMYSSYAGTAADTSLLLDYLPGYIFPHSERTIDHNIVLGISLGGHAAWHVIMQDPRFSAAIPVIGCPDYARLMADRARLSKRKHWLETQGRHFLGSPDFPPSLLEILRRTDPASLVASCLRDTPREQAWSVLEDTDGDKAALAPLMARCFGNKRILVLSGGADKLVSYAHSKPFLDWLKGSAAEGGWFAGGGLHLEDYVYEGIGHEVPGTMVAQMVKFVNETLDTTSTESHFSLGSTVGVFQQHGKVGDSKI
ncbi:uncharacterized protein A1O9_00024 [Exophiala aquamarina CBS 119918]|uniref:AB hydrolase-1 domain-containing protein n=1 Tax=Exophiala aquamarina CBS 119918 TaxID=1182545 RepID=A0A072PQL7_9EURO|nr:uncharacterized protein A1O9_00024 [Exophiala aquamarina CBS 119918]KEF62052.1 hypothetical protein A1O9_00024 [Exophiala aquamarina CBS 119918]